MRYIFKRDYRHIYPDGLARDYFTGSLADDLKSDIINELIRKKYIFPIQDRAQHDTK